MRRRLIHWTLLVCSLLSACAKHEFQHHPPNIVLIVIDTLRADHVGAYGYPRTTTPALDRFAAKGVVFSHAITPAPWTAPTLASVMTGEYPSRHGLLATRDTKVTVAAIRDDVPMLAERLSAHGYRTVAIVNNDWINAVGSFKRGFQTWHKLPATQLADSVNTFVRQEMSVDDPRPLFLWAHYFDVHAPYVGHPKRGKEPPIPDIPEAVPAPQADQPARRVPNPEYIAGLETIGDYLRTYDRGVRSWDRSFGELVEWLTARNAFANTIFIVISDHGDAFAEHGRWSHGFALYQEMLGVVWIMRSPTLRPARIDTPVSLVDVLPTLARVAELDLGDDADGVAVLPSPPSPRVVWSERLIRHDEKPREIAARCGEYKVVFSPDGRSRTYDLQVDPLERTPLTDTHDAAACFDAWAQFRQRPLRIASTVTLDAATREKLHALGY